MAIIERLIIEKVSANDDFATISVLNYKNGDYIESGAILMEYESSKASSEIIANTSGYVRYLCQVMDIVNVGTSVVEIYDSNYESDRNEREVINMEETNQLVSGLSSKKPQITKLAAKLLVQYGLNEHLFYGKDLVNKYDVENYIKSKVIISKELTSKEMNGEENKGSEINIKLFDNARDNTLLNNVNNENGKLVHLQASKLVENKMLSQNNLCASTIYTYVDVSEDMLKDTLKNHLLSHILQILPYVLKKYPMFNAYYLDNKVFYYDDINIGLAVDFENQGLRVLNLESIENYTIEQIQGKLMKLMYKYKKNNLSIQDNEGCTFTVTDLSNEGVAFFQPLIGYKQSSVMGISAIDKKLNRVIISLTFDHRVTEGKQAALFLRYVKKHLETARGEKSEI